MRRGLSTRLSAFPALLFAGTLSLAAQAPAAPAPAAPAPAQAPPAAPVPATPPATAPATPAPAPPPAAAPSAAAHLPASCACAKGGGTLEHGLQVAQEIFVGEVVGVQLVGLEIRRYTLLVSSSWKSDLQTVQAETAAGPCGAKLEIGQPYLLYGTWKQDRSVVLIGACIRYVPLEGATEDLARLGKATYERPITPERRQSVVDGAEQSKKARGCAAHIQDAPAFFLPATRTIKFEHQRLLDDSGMEIGSFQGTWTPRKGSEGIFVELVVNNQTSCTLHLHLEARAGGQPVHLSRNDEFIPSGPPFRVRFVVMPAAGWSGEVELKATWELAATGG